MTTFVPDPTEPPAPATQMTLAQVCYVAKRFISRFSLDFVVSGSGIRLVGVVLLDFMV